MRTVIRWQAECIRKRFQIYGAFNCVSLLTVTLVLLAGSRCLLLMIPEKQYFYLIFLGFFHVLFSDKVLECSLEECWQAAFYFRSLNKKQLLCYYTVRWFCVYEAAAVWILLPHSKAELFSALLTFLTLNLLLWIKLQEKHYLSEVRYTAWNTSQNIGICLGLFFYGKWKASLPFLSFLSSSHRHVSWISFIFFLCVCLCWRNYRVVLNSNQIQDKREIAAVSRFTFFFPPSKELLYIMRKRIWIDGLFVGLTGNFISYTVIADSSMERFETAVCTWTGIFILIYIEIMHGENGRLFPFYNRWNGWRLRLDKMAAVLQISVVLFILIGSLQALLLSMPVLDIILAYFLTAFVFVLSVLTCRTTFEKSGNRKQVLMTREVFKQLIFVMAGSILIIGAVEYGMAIIN